MCNNHKVVFHQSQWDRFSLIELPQKHFEKQQGALQSILVTSWMSNSNFTVETMLSSVSSEG